MTLNPNDLYLRRENPSKARPEFQPNPCGFQVGLKRALFWRLTFKNRGYRGQLGSRSIYNVTSISGVWKPLVGCLGWHPFSKNHFNKTSKKLHYPSSKWQIYSTTTIQKTCLTAAPWSNGAFSGPNNWSTFGSLSTSSCPALKIDKLHPKGKACLPKNTHGFLYGRLVCYYFFKECKCFI